MVGDLQYTMLTHGKSLGQKQQQQKTTGVKKCSISTRTLKGTKTAVFSSYCNKVQKCLARLSKSNKIKQNLLRSEMKMEPLEKSDIQF